MDVEYHNRKPQEDVPVDQIIHYIVKDYQRMFLTFNDMKERAEKAEAKTEPEEVPERRHVNNELTPEEKKRIIITAALISAGFIALVTVLLILVL